MLRPAPSICVPAALLMFGLAIAACGSDNPKLMVTGMEPDKGDAQGATTVRITGNRFKADGPRTARVYFGGRQGNVIGFESDSVLVVQAPGGKPNEVVDVLIVFDPGGRLKIPGGFRFVERSHTGPSVDDLDISKDKK